jgi:hypothetical protein
MTILSIAQVLRCQALLLGMLIVGCGGNQPKVVGEAQKNTSTSISHVNLTSNCSDCHLQDRGADSVDIDSKTGDPLTVTHGLGADCSECHAFPSFPTIIQKAKLHSPAPSVCMGCHSRATTMAQHAARGECATCHRFGAAWVPF